MTTWDDFNALFGGLLSELDKLAKANERIRAACDSMSKTYEELIDEQTEG